MQQQWRGESGLQTQAHARIALLRLSRRTCCSPLGSICSCTFSTAAAILTARVRRTQRLLGLLLANVAVARLLITALLLWHKRIITVVRVIDVRFAVGRTFVRVSGRRGESM